VTRNKEATVNQSTELPAKSRTGSDPARTFAARHYRRIEDCTMTVDGMKRNPGATSPSRVLALVRASVKSPMATWRILRRSSRPLREPLGFGETFIHSNGLPCCGRLLRSYARTHANWQQSTRSTVAILLLRIIFLV